MRKIKFIYKLCLMACLSCSTSCNFLDVEPYFKDMLQYDVVFTEKTTTEEWLWSTYSTLRGYGVGVSYDPLSFASDDAVYTDSGNGCEIYQNGTYSSMFMMSEHNKWDWFYIGIRKASVFIANVDKCVEINSNERQKLKAEARFLRAYFHWILMKQFGPIVLLPEEGQDVTLSYEDLALPRSSFDDCVEFVVSELEQAAKVLPLTYSSIWEGRATIGAALAVRAQVLLYAASPLYNGNTDLFNLKDDKGNVLINQTVINKKWGRAAAAAKEVMNMNLYRLHTIPRTAKTPALPAGVSDLVFPAGAGDIDPFESYRQCFNGETPITRHPEIIFFRQNYPGDINAILSHSFPLTHKGVNDLAVTLKQVNAYYMRDGRDINNSSEEYKYTTKGFTTFATNDPYAPTDVSMMFANREPRFYASISYNNCIWENLTAPSVDLQNFRVNYYRAAGDGKQLSKPFNSPMTGIGIKKYYNPDDSWDTDGRVIHKIEPTFRYADVLLWYAEALNELTDTYTFPDYTGSGQVSVSRDPQEMSKAFSQVRYRAGIPNLSEAEYKDRYIFKEKVKRERQIELFLETSRYFDLRRWKDAAIEENQPVMGMNVDMKASSGQKELFYTPTPVMMKKVFMAKMYLWPINDVEMKKNAKLTQNPGW